MLEIEGSDIAKLNDTDLRKLIGLLCEAELSNLNLSTSGVTWGGNQNAADGGIDVRVKITRELPPDNFIPRAITGFQVKKPDLSASEIKEEMCPNGSLRASISDLIDSKGAYIIASGESSTTDQMLFSRRSAMRNAIGGHTNAENLVVDFYDGGRIATWARSHPSMILWVREKSGRPIQGWKPFGNWARCPNGEQEEYLADGTIRIRDDASTDIGGLSSIDGINAIREKLHRPGSSVRLIGLSGVGKTRLIQALFDDRIGEKPLNKSTAFYTDTGESPLPEPKHFAEQLKSLNKRSILVVDNCSPELHRELTKICTDQESLLSVITVEYDVRDDLPEETNVFHLEPASAELIERVIKTRYKHISEIDIKTIAGLSGGNARLAIALANTINKGENLSNFKDTVLFSRLFNQGHSSDKTFLKVAEVCSLVYSFSCEIDDKELELISSLAGLSVRELFENIRMLQRRELIQERSKWRAVLPHALANRLAQSALQNTPLTEIRKAFEEGGSNRLLLSFSRRLSYLHESKEAISIVSAWLSNGGFLSDLSNLNQLGIEVLRNVAPVEPEVVLRAMERAATQDIFQRFLSTANSNRTELMKLLRSLAYDQERFARSVKLLIQFANLEKDKEINSSTKNILNSLVYIIHSGTHASAEQRLNIIKDLLSAGAPEEVNIAFELLSATLTTSQFYSPANYEFGARPRNYGYWPQSHDEIKQWFGFFLDFVQKIAVSNSELSVRAKLLLAEKFRGLWSIAGMQDELEAVARNIAKAGFWGEGWAAIKAVIHIDRKQLDPTSISRLTTLSRLLEPQNIIDRIRVYALSQHHRLYDLIDAEEEDTPANSYEKTIKETRLLGLELANNKLALNILLDDCLSIAGARLFNLGQGLADGCEDPVSLWAEFKARLSKIETPNRNFQLLRGFLNSIYNKSYGVANRLLDDAIDDPVLGLVFPALQTSVTLDEKGVERLKASLTLNSAPIWHYRTLLYGSVTKTLTDDDFCAILRLVASKPQGDEIAVELFSSRLEQNTNDQLPSSKILVVTGQEIALNYLFSQRNRKSESRDYELGKIVTACFSDKEAHEAAQELSRKIASAFANYEATSTEHNELLSALALRQPVAFLEGFLDENIGVSRQINWDFSDDIINFPNPLAQIDNKLIIDWCENSPLTRYPSVARLIKPYQAKTINNEGSLEWTPLALEILARSFDPIIILNIFKTSLRPMSWTGSLAKLLEAKMSLIVVLKGHTNPAIAKWAILEENKFRAIIQSQRELELKLRSNTNDGFE